MVYLHGLLSFAIRSMLSSRPKILLLLYIAVLFFKGRSMADKLFYKGRQDPRDKYESIGFENKRKTLPGTQNSPLLLTVTSNERKADIEKTLKDNNLVAKIHVDTEAVEDISSLEAMLKKPEPVVVDKTPKRNDPCSCGSGKKYKKCCG